MEELMNWMPTILTIISTLAGAGIIGRLVPDKYLTWLIKAKSVVDEIHRVSEDVEKALRESKKDK